MVRSSSKIKKFLVFQEMELSGSNIKRFLIFSQKKAFLIFREMKLFIFQETKTRKSSLYFRKGNFVAFQKTKIPKKCFIFQETELSYISGKRKLSNIFSGKGYSEPWHIQNIYFRIFNPATSCLNPQFFSLKNATLKIFLLIWETEFFIYFRKWNFLALYFRN